jgi:rhamnose transport system permease protein
MNARRELLLAIIILALIVGVGIRAPAFVTPSSLLGVLTDTSFLFMLALAQMAVLLTRGIDLSVAANLALTGMVVALVNHAAPQIPIAAIVVMAIAIGAALGLINAALIAGLGIPPIVVTLGTLAVYRGMIFVIAHGAWLTSKDMSPAFLAMPKTGFLGLSSLVWIAAAVALAAWIYLNHTAAGRALYAVGGNPVAARYCGIDLRRQQLTVYTVAGAVSGLCGYLWVARYGIAYSDIALGYELTVIAACVIGGVSIAGGVGSVAGALLGALFLGVIVNALPVINVSPFWQMAISGAVILAAVIVNSRSERRAGKLILPEARRSAATVPGGAHS